MANFILYFKVRSSPNDERYALCEDVVAKIKTLPQSVQLMIRPYDVSVNKPSNASVTHVPTICAVQSGKMYVGDEVVAFVDGMMLTAACMQQQQHCEPRPKSVSFKIDTKGDDDHGGIIYNLDKPSRQNLMTFNRAAASAAGIAAGTKTNFERGMTSDEINRMREVDKRYNSFK